MMQWLLVASAAFVAVLLLIFTVAAVGHLKWWLRNRRNRKETQKAAMDQWMYGAGVMTVDSEGKAEHIPYEKLWSTDKSGDAHGS
jgi:hypothetical protein